MRILTKAFRVGLQAGLAAPIAIYAPPVPYVVAAQTISPAAAFGVVGALLSASTAAVVSQGD